MAHWLLQHNPARGECSLGDGDWVIRRYRDRVAAGDDVAIWLSGRHGGVVAVGTVTEAPRPGPDGVPVAGITVGRAFRETPITRAELREDGRWQEAMVLRMPAGGNPFPVTPQEWQAVTELAPTGPGAR